MNLYIFPIIVFGILFLLLVNKRYKRIKHKKNSGYSINLISKFRKIAKSENKTIIHCMHIGKTGGSAVKLGMHLKGKPFINDKYIIIGNRHTFTLKNVLPGEKCFFFVRDPIQKFISAFYSRKRKGMPRFYREWSKGEKKSFSKFNTPNELANALNSKNIKKKNDAIYAMNNIYHIRSSYWNWFDSEEYFLSRKNDILFIGNQKNLNDDFEKIKSILNLPDHFSMPTDPVKMHKNPEGFDKNIDEFAIKNLKKWYKKDYDFLNLVSSL